MATSYQRVVTKPLETIIILNEEEQADLYTIIVKTADLLRDWPGDLDLGDSMGVRNRVMTERILREQAERLYRTNPKFQHRVEYKQRHLSLVQRLYSFMTKDYFYVKGLEFWILDNERRWEKAKKVIDGKARNQKLREAGLPIPKPNQSKYHRERNDR